MSTDAFQTKMLQDHERRLATIEYNLRIVMAQLRIDWQEPPATNALPQEALDFLAKGDKMRGIQVLVTKLGMSLTDAKARIETGR